MRLLCTFPTAADFSPEIRVDVSFASILRECSILTFGGQVASPTAVGTVQNVEGNTEIVCKWFNPLSHDSGKMSHPFAATMSSLKLMPLTKAAATAVEWQSTKPELGAEAMPLYELPMGVPFVLPFICRETKRHKMNSCRMSLCRSVCPTFAECGGEGERILSRMLSTLLLLDDDDDDE